jgi:aryl-phospho-beta-D-glucosidase BglC (GH1 family)
MRTYLNLNFWLIWLFVYLTLTCLPIHSKPEFRGVSLSHLLSQRGNYSLADIENFFSIDTDLIRIKSMGFNIVRIPIDPRLILFNEDKLTYLLYLDRLVEKFVSTGVAVIICLQADGDFKVTLSGSNDLHSSFVSLWKDIAIRYSSYGNNVIYEILNEPAFTAILPSIDIANEKWHSIQKDVVENIREISLEQQIIVTDAGWSTSDSLVHFNYSYGENIIYGLHFYDPQAFTHQAAEFLEFYRNINNIPYPSSNSECMISEPSWIRSVDLFRGFRQAYCLSSWNKELLEKKLHRVFDWARTTNRKIMLVEFGVIRNADKQSKIRWLNDVAQILDNYNIDWVMWDYKGDFSLLDRDTQEVDNDLLNSLEILPH